MKKAQDAMMLTKILFALAGIAVLAGITYNLVKEGGFAEQREQCRLSATFKHAAIQGTRGIGEVFNLACTTHDLKFSKKGIYRDGKKIDSLDLDNPANADKSMKQAIANEMYDCWYQFKGLNFFKDTTSNLRCVPCAEINAEPEVLQKIKVLPNFYS